MSEQAVTNFDPADYADTPQKSKAQIAFETAMQAVFETATAEDHKRASDIIANDKGIRDEEVSATVAAVIFTNHNRVNRNFSFSRCYGFVESMKRGEWKRNHQGVAFYDDNTMADGQHRMAACALSGVAITVPVYSDFEADSIDSIDRSTKRTAGEALEMMGISDGKLKATMAKVTIGYVQERESGKKPNLTDQQIEKFVLDNEDVCNTAVEIGRASVKNVSDASLSQSLATQIAAIMLMGGWDKNRVTGFVASVQQGIATYPESPTVELARKLVKAKYADRKKDRMNNRQVIALSIKSASLWVRETSVGKLAWNATKEDLPDFHMPDLKAEAAEKAAAEAAE